VGEVKPTPTLPVDETTKAEVPEVFTWNTWEVLVVPIPTLPPFKAETYNVELVALPTWKTPVGLVIPTPRLPLSNTVKPWVKFEP